MLSYKKHSRNNIKEVCEQFPSLLQSTKHSPAMTWDVLMMLLFKKKKGKSILGDRTLGSESSSTIYSQNTLEKPLNHFYKMKKLGSV